MPTQLLFTLSVGHFAISIFLDGCHWGIQLIFSLVLFDIISLLICYRSPSVLSLPSWAGASAKTVNKFGKISVECKIISRLGYYGGIRRGQQHIAYKPVA